MTEVRGLEDVVAADSGICYIDGDKGVLSYRGIDIHELSAKSSFEEVCFLLWERRLPRKEELEALRTEIGRGRVLPSRTLELLATLARHLSPMDALRTVVSALVETDPDGASMSAAANRRKAVRLTGQLGTIVAGLHRIRQDKVVVAADPGRTHADDFLRMLSGETERSAAIRALDIALVLHADHELNASTFAARVTASTLADMHAAITSAVATLKGPLHGGANESVMNMLLEIGSLDRVDDVVRGRLARKEKIMGFGHRVYTTEDPRATRLREMSREVAESSGDTRWYDISRRIEQIVKEEKRLNANVDFYSASLYHVLGIPSDLFTPIFAVSRIAGWTAHVLEQYANNRLIRPRAEYTGPPYPQPYVPMGER
ncbi:MAG TPA: citrate/2-methylcitrate synthase [Thermoanaerobaculia bacterium]|jgi:citrate synthase